MKLTEIRDAQLTAARIASKGAPASSRRAARHFADLVVKRGIAIKNRLGASNVPVPLMDGCYYLVKIEPLRKKRGRG